MARVDFYVLAAPGEQARRQFACRLAEKAYRLDHRVRILAADPQAAAQIDELLWTWRDGSFVPHEILKTGTAPESPVTISSDQSAHADSDLLINLSDALPASAGAFPRIAEIVSSDDEQRRHGRERFAQYREQGHTLETHKL
jgi:DNA polymerase-3 subunit chi